MPISFLTKSIYHNCYNSFVIKQQKLKAMKLYYILNNFWIYSNMWMIIPFFLAGLNRFINRGKTLNHSLWTDHITRFFLIVTWIFYILDVIVKYPIDGIDTFCQKAFFLHHISSIFLLPPLFMNSYIPWWVTPIGWMHGILLFRPDIFWLNYVYVGFVFIFHYGLYQSPYKNMKGYWIVRFCINYINVFFIMMAMDDTCTNSLPLIQPMPIQN